MVNSTLNVFDHLLNAAGRCQEQGRFREALRLLTQLADFRDLPSAIAEQTQARLAELQLKRRKYKRARRHLAVALQHSPDEAHYHYSMATALVNDRDGDMEQAAEHYRRSLELNPEQVKCLYEYGLLLVRLGQTDKGLKHLRQAVAEAPADADAAAKLAKGLRLSGQTEEAGEVLRAALFRNPRAPRFRKLWNEYQFQQLRQEQDVSRVRRAASRRREETAVILPFVRLDPAHPVSAPPHENQSATVSPPPRRRPSGRSDQRNVQ